MSICGEWSYMEVMGQGPLEWLWAKIVSALLERRTLNITTGLVHGWGANGSTLHSPANKVNTDITFTVEAQEIKYILYIYSNYRSDLDMYGPSSSYPSRR
jgi:hypothetical protein